MAETAVLLRVRDHKGVLKLLGIAGLQLGKALPLSVSGPQFMVIAEEGFWLVSEAEGPRRSFAHTLEFVAYSRATGISLSLSDAARRAEDPWDRLEGMDLLLSYQDAAGCSTDVRVDGGLVLESARSDEDAPRLWDLVSELIAKGVGEGCAVKVTVSSST